MAKSRPIEPPRLNRSGRTMLMLFLVGVGAIQMLRPVGTCAVCLSDAPPIQEASDDPTVELTRGRERANATQQDFETIKRLSEKGSASRHALRRADMQRKVALLEYSSLLNPARREKNLLLKAEVILNFHTDELDVMQELFSRGSISKVEYLRAVAARDIAAASFKAAQSFTMTQRSMQAIKVAQSKLEVARQEYEIAKRLFESQAIGQTTLDRALSNLRIATAEMESRKQSLGARAVQVKQ